LHRKSVRKRLARGGFLAVNIAVLAVIILFVVQNPHSDSSAAIKSSAVEDASADTNASNPIDQVSSANIALTVAQMSRLPEATAVTNQADTQDANLTAATSAGNIIDKPQVVQTALKSRADIQTITAQSGDSVSSLAAKYGVTSNSIQWSNGLTSNTIAAGTKVIIPPVTGIVYTVKAGDTPDSLATSYKADEGQIIAYNDAEINGLQPGEQIIIPNGTIAAAPAIVATSSSITGATSLPFTALYGGNGYDFGYCTWYVATQIAVPTNWGNASSWAYYARASGWTVSSTPTVGAIAQTAYAAGGEGHVAVVDGVSADGRTIHVRDMNDYGDGGGFDRVGSGWVSVSTYQNYITH
jgi:surface antigen